MIVVEWIFYGHVTSFLEPCLRHDLIWYNKAAALTFWQASQTVTQHHEHTEATPPPKLHQSLKINSFHIISFKKSQWIKKFRCTETEGPGGWSIPNPILISWDLFHGGHEHVSSDQNSVEHNQLYSRWQRSGQPLYVEAIYGNRTGVFSKVAKKASASQIQMRQLTLKKYN